MTLVPRNGTLLNPLPMLFDDFFSRDLFNWGNSNFSGTNTTIPAVNIKETPENYEVEVAAPGMTKKDFKVELDGNTLTISSKKSDEREDKEGENYSRKEFSYQSFQRTLRQIHCCLNIFQGLTSLQKHCCKICFLSINFYSSYSLKKKV